MCDFCENIPVVEKWECFEDELYCENKGLAREKIVLVRYENKIRFYGFNKYHYEDDALYKNADARFCPMCGRKLSEETGHSDSIRQTVKEVAEEMPALGRYDGDYAFPCGTFGYMDDLYRVDFSCSNCGKRHEGVIFGNDVSCECGKIIRTGQSEETKNE